MRRRALLAGPAFAPRAPVALAVMLNAAIAAACGGAAGESGDSGVGSVDDASPIMPDHGPVGWTWGYAKSIVADGWGLVTAPTRWQSPQWIEAGAVAAVGVGLYFGDASIRDWTQRHRNRTSDQVAKAVRPFGRDYLWYGEAAFAVGSFVIPDERVTRTALLGAENALFAESCAYGILQILTNRKRPYQGAGSHAWDGPALSTGDHSFPSGHTTKAWSAMTIVATEWGDVPGVAPAAYGIATLVGLSRINDDSHWASDVFAGAALGYFIGKGIEAMHPRGGPRRDGIVLAPVFGPGGTRGIAISIPL